MTTSRNPVRSAGFAWGRRRVQLGLSLREVSEKSGIAKGLLSLMENGRLIPTADEYEAVAAALYPEVGATSTPPAEPAAPTQ